MVGVVGKRLHDNLRDIIIACETINSDSKCHECPLREDCLDDMSFAHIAYEVKAEALEKLVFMAEEIAEAQKEREKSEYDRRWEAEADYWNDRRCDPNGYDE